MPVKNLLDKTFGRLTVIERDFSKPKGAAFWLCKCSCGNPELYSARGSALLSGQTTHCKKCNPYKGKNIDTTSLVGKIFGRLTVIERDLTKPTGHGRTSFWICKCKCGNIVSVGFTQLTTGKTKSCGCIHKERASKMTLADISNQKFGTLIPLKRTEQKGNDETYLWECICQECKKIEYYTVTQLRLDKIKCKHCQSARSKGEILINNILTLNNINFKEQYMFNDFKPYKYDFAILDENDNVIRLIEFDGEQHFKPNDFFGGQKEFEQIQYRDNLKNNYTKNKNIPLIRIPYWDMKKISLELLMGEDYLCL